MMLVLGLIVLTAAVVVGSVGVASNTGAAHQLPDGFSFLGYHVHGSVGEVFFGGMVVGVIGMIGLVMVVDGLRRNAAVRRELAKLRREDRTAPAAVTPAPREPQPPVTSAPRAADAIGRSSSASPSSSARAIPPGSFSSRRRATGTDTSTSTGDRDMSSAG
jgi:hypothetical protein